MGAMKKTPGCLESFGSLLLPSELSQVLQPEFGDSKSWVLSNNNAALKKSILRIWSLSKLRIFEKAFFVILTMQTNLAKMVQQSSSPSPKKTEVSSAVLYGKLSFVVVVVVVSIVVST